MKEITPVAGSTNFSSILCLKNFYFVTLWQSAVLGAFRCQSVLASPKINRKKCYGWNAIYRNKFGDFSSVFGRIWHVDYVCSYEKGWKTNARDSYINPGVYLIHAYCSTLQHKNQLLFHGMSDLKDFIFSLRSTRSLAAPIEKSEIKHLKNKRKKWYPPSFMVYLLGLN